MSRKLSKRVNQISELNFRTLEFILNQLKASINPVQRRLEMEDRHLGPYARSRFRKTPFIGQVKNTYKEESWPLQESVDRMDSQMLEKLRLKKAEFSTGSDPLQAIRFEMSDG